MPCLYGEARLGCARSKERCLIEVSESVAGDVGQQKIWWEGVIDISMSLGHSVVHSFMAPTRNDIELHNGEKEERKTPPKNY